MIKVEKIIPGGQALATGEDGKKIFFWNALPGEDIVSYQITKHKSHYLEAIATSINNPSPFRVEPKDTCFLSTSPWQIIDYSSELQLKAALVQEIFREHRIDLETPAVITDNHPYYYRNKMEYALYWDNITNQIELAFHARGSHRKVPIKSSSLENPAIFHAATSIIDELNVKKEAARKYQSLLLRCNQQGEVSGGLFENGQPHPTFHNLTDQILGQNYSYSPNGFFQINLPVYEMALQTIKPFITTDEVLDLYAGVGTIGLSVAREHHLTLVECNQSAFSELQKNSKNARAVLAKSEEVLDFIQSTQTVILDPPRAGCDTKLIERLLSVSPRRIIYLSCNPATQARDVKALLAKYHLEKNVAFNFFPRTPHIENLIVLSL